MKKKVVGSVLGLLVNISLSADPITSTIEQAGKKLLGTGTSSETSKIFLTAAEEKKGRLAELEQEKKQLTGTEKRFVDATVAHIQEVKALLLHVRQEVKEHPDDEFLNKKLYLLNDRYHILNDLQRMRAQLISRIDQNIELLKDYLKDPQLKGYRKDLKIEQRLVYTFDDLQNLNQLIADKEKELAQLADHEKNADIELKSRKRIAAATVQEHKKRKEEQEAIGSSDAFGKAFDLGVQQKTELLALQEQLYSDKQEQDSLRLKEIEHKKGLIKTQMFLVKLHLDVLKDVRAQIKPAIQVSEEEVILAQEEFAKKEQQAFTIKEEYRQEIDEIVGKIAEKEEALHAAAEKYHVPLGADLDAWERKPLQTADGYLAFLEVAAINDSIQLLKTHKDLLEAQIALEDEKIRYELVTIDMKDTFHKIIKGKLVEEEDTRTQMRKYDAFKAEARANFSLNTERRDTMLQRLASEKKIAETIKELRTQLAQQKNSLFKNNMEDYSRLSELLNSVEEKVAHQVDLLIKINNTYADVIAALTKTNKQIELIVAELEQTTIWQRSRYAITWDGIARVVPNLHKFARDVRRYIFNVEPSSTLSMLSAVAHKPMSVLWFLLKLFALIAIALFVRWGLPRAIAALPKIARRYPSLGWICSLLGMLLEFIALYYTGLCVWLAICFLMHLYPTADPYPHIIFYLLSIPYFLYLANRFITYFVRVNSEREYLFLEKDYHKRFIFMGTVLAYATIAIVFFRHAFMLGGYTKSELPNILLAVNFIIFQISLIFLISKEQILSIIPPKEGVWETIRGMVDQYYYLVLMIAITIIVMSNPFVGFGTLVMYVLSQLVYTALLLAFVILFYISFRRGLSYVFFTIEKDVARERFAYARTSYSVLVIALFLIAMSFGSIVGAKIWGWPSVLSGINNWTDFVAWLKTPMLLEETAKISIFSVLQLVFFVLVGLAVAFIVNRFVFAKIFDVLLVDAGVQNTVASITRYLILLMSLVVGFESIGLGEYVYLLIGALIVSIGWVIKEPIGDFVAYFIILVRRPVKIGDYIKIDEEIAGVVRKITPLSVMLRKKNSMTIILPNTMIITKPLMNWNYSRSFTAINDIMVIIPYKEDPALVKKLLLQVLDENSFVLKNPNPVVRLEEFGEYGFVFLVRGFLSSNYTLDQWDIAADIRLAIVTTLRKNGINLAIPTHISFVTSKLNQQTGGASVMGQRDLPK